MAQSRATIATGALSHFRFKSFHRRDTEFAE
jgi:hypothetical protein